MKIICECGNILEDYKVRDETLDFICDKCKLCYFVEVR